MTGNGPAACFLLSAGEVELALAPTAIKGTIVANAVGRVLDQRKLALVVEDKMADGSSSNFNKLVSREAVQA